jgi:hypothetical protein
MGWKNHWKKIYYRSRTSMYLIWLDVIWLLGKNIEYITKDEFNSFLSSSDEIYNSPNSVILKKIPELSPPANYTDRATVACRRS